LDAGCGAHAYLTAYLRSQGIEAYGFDRRLEVNAEYLREADWFDLPLGRSRWGTVTANLSFANHLRFAERYEPRSLPRYRERYHDILDSLAPEGSFVYAPAARILEEGVDRNRFAVEEWDTPAGHQVARVTKIPNLRPTLRARTNPEP
jgi:hypothetical protein